MDARQRCVDALKLYIEMLEEKTATLRALAAAIEKGTVMFAHPSGGVVLTQLAVDVNTEAPVFMNADRGKKWRRVLVIELPEET